MSCIFRISGFRFSESQFSILFPPSLSSEVDHKSFSRESKNISCDRIPSPKQTMTAFTSTPVFSHNVTGSRNENMDVSFGLLTISEDEPMRSCEFNSSSNNLNHSMSRSKSYKVDLSSLGGSSAMQLSSHAHHSICDDATSWGYFVDSVNQR